MSPSGNRTDEMAGDIKHYFRMDDCLDVNNNDNVSKKISTFGYLPKTIKKQIQSQIKNKKKAKELLFIQIKHQENIIENDVKDFFEYLQIEFAKNKEILKRSKSNNYG